VATARRLLAELGVTLIDLVDQDAQQAGMPTWADYLPRVIAAAGPGATRTYGTYWARMATAWGTRALTRRHHRPPTTTGAGSPHPRRTRTVPRARRATCSSRPACRPLLLG
jgi:hypothetical protein